jgi:heterodisulfide reductase subunit C
MRSRIALSWYFALASLARLMLWRRAKTRERLLSRYRPDGILPVADSERAVFPSFQKCVACSLCTFSCEGIKQGRAAPSFEPKYLLLAIGRSSLDSETFREEWFPCAECDVCTVECPNDVPIHGMVEEIRARRDRLGFRK